MSKYLSPENSRTSKAIETMNTNGQMAYNKTFLDQISRSEFISTRNGKGL